MDRSLTPDHNFWALAKVGHVDILAWSSAVVIAVAAVKLARAVRRENRRINDMIQNADQIIADSSGKVDKRARQGATDRSKQRGTLTGRQGPPRPA